MASATIVRNYHRSLKMDTPIDGLLPLLHVPSGIPVPIPLAIEDAVDTLET